VENNWIDTFVGFFESQKYLKQQILVRMKGK
jgi:hypothetical protein